MLVGFLQLYRHTFFSLHGDYHVNLFLNAHVLRKLLVFWTVIIWRVGVYGFKIEEDKSIGENVENALGQMHPDEYFKIFLTKFRTLFRKFDFESSESGQKNDTYMYY